MVGYKLRNKVYLRRYENPENMLRAPSRLIYLFYLPEKEKRQLNKHARILKEVRGNDLKAERRYHTDMTGNGLQSI
jgi:hypothetical protein